jgi:hypothetical protein
MGFLIGDVLLRRRFVTETICYRRRSVTETFCYGDVVYEDVLSRICFVRIHFVCLPCTLQALLFSQQHLNKH